MRRLRRGIGLGIVLLAGVACARTPASGPSLRLADLYRPEMVEGRQPVAAEPGPRTEWRFDGPPGEGKGPLIATRGFEAGPGVAGLAIRNDRLEGRTTGVVPLLHVAREGVPVVDVIHEVQVRLRVSAGTELLMKVSAEKVDL